MAHFPKFLKSYFFISKLIIVHRATILTSIKNNVQ